MECPYQNQKLLERDFDATNDTVTKNHRLSRKHDAEETVLKSVSVKLDGAKPSQKESSNSMETELKCIRDNGQESMETELKHVCNNDHHLVKNHEGSNPPELNEVQNSHSFPGPTLTSIEPLSSDSMIEDRERAEYADFNESSFVPDFPLNLKSCNSQ